MFRLTQYMHELVTPTAPRRRVSAGGVKPVVIWNLTRTCNLKSVSYTHLDVYKRQD